MTDLAETTMSDGTPSDIPAESGATPRDAVDPSQQGSSGGADAPQNPFGAAETVPRAEFDKVVGQRQAAKEKMRQLSRQVDELLARVGTMPGEEELRAFQEWRSRQQEAGVSHEQQREDITFIEDRVRQPLEDRVDALRSRKDALEKQLTDLLRDQELRVAAARADAVNPEPEFLTADGQPVFDGPERVTDVRRFVDLFLSQPENANLVRSTVTPGSGAKQAGGLATNLDSIPRTKAEFLALPPERRLAVANRMSRQQRDAILGRGSPDGGGYL